MTTEEESFELSDDGSGEESLEESVEGSDDGSGEESVEGSGSEEEETQTEELSGWADSMSKILRSTKPKNKKSLILSRARKDYEVNKNPAPKKGKGNDIEIAKDEDGGEEDGDDDGDVKVESEDSSIFSEKKQRKLELQQRKLERAWENLNRITTTNPDREMEVDLLKIATKGVVQLFNAVSQQQKTVKSKLRASSKSEFKKEKVLSQSKDLFDKAMSKNKIVEKDGSDEDSEDDDPTDVKTEYSSDDDEDGGYVKEVRKRKLKTTSAESSSKKPMWQALQDDFMLDAKLKDWDKDSDSD